MSIIEMSAAGAAIILAAVLLRAAGKNRLPVGAFEALWALAWARLVLPVRLPFRLSAWTLLQTSAAVVALSPAAPGTGAAMTTMPVPPTVDIIPTLADTAPVGPRLSPWTLIWLAGAAVCALALALCYVRVCRRFRDAEAIDNDYVNRFLAEHPLRRQVSVRVSDRVGAPLTYGVLRPVILLPRSLDLENTGMLGYVLAHELAHIRRLDAARKLALAAAVCLHWFDPLVWLMATLAGRDMERACDRAVVDAFGPEARRDYAMTLLDLEERRGGFAGLASGFSKNAIEERIHSIMKIRPRTFLSTLLAFVLVLTVGAAFATAAPEDEAVIGGADGPTYIVVSDDTPAVSSGEVIASSDGTVYIFTDDGKPVSMTQQEYKALVQPVKVEWWTAEEYAEWLEQEKKDLQDCLGQRAWTSADGWFTWTQEKIDETIAMYEQVLDEIEDGLLVSKTVDGRSDVSLMQGVGDDQDSPDSGSGDGVITYTFGDTDDGWTFHIMTEDEAAAMQEQNEAADEERQQLTERLAQLDAERAEIEQKLAAMGEAEAEADGTETVPANRNVTVFFEQADGAPYGEIEAGSRMRLADDVHAAAGSVVAVSLATRTDATLTVSLRSGADSMDQSVELKAGEPQIVTFSPEETGSYELYLVNDGDYPVEFVASRVVS